MGSYGFPPAEQIAYRAPVPERAMFELRPLSIGEILDRTFMLYRQRFWLYVGLSAVTAAVSTLIIFAQISVGLIGRRPSPNVDPAAMMQLGLKTMAVSLVGLAVHLLAYGITQAATVSAVEASYLGHETSIGKAFSSVSAKWFRYVLITMWQIWSLMWPMLALVIPTAVIAAFVAVGAGKAAAALVVGLVILLMIPGIVVGFILYLRNSLGIVASVSEGLGVRAAMKRSKNLVADYKVRAFLLYLLYLVLASVAGAVQQFFNFFLISSHGAARVGFEISTLLVTFISGSLVQPVLAIAFVLFYIDQRVRKEGFDVEMLLSKVTGAPPPPLAMESPYGASLPGMFVAPGAAQESPFSSPFGTVPVPAREANSPFTTPVGSPFAPGGFGTGQPPADPTSPFSSGPLPGSSDTKPHE